jgi:hypothetical protein
MRRHLATIRRAFVPIPCLLLAAAPAWSDQILLPEDTVVQAALGEKVTSGDPIGYEPEAYVWRDVKVGGVTVIEAGTPILVEITNVLTRGMGGESGAIELTAVHLIVRDQEIALRGGYGQQEEDSQVLSTAVRATAGAAGVPFGNFSGLMPGRNAVLDKGTLFNTGVLEDTYIEVPDADLATLDLRGPASVSIAVIRQEITATSTALPLSVYLCGQAWPDEIFIEEINEESIDPIPATVVSVSTEGDCDSARVNVQIDALKRHFESGVNHFVVTVGGVTGEVALNVQL